jgi:hypothetical protein
MYFFGWNPRELIITVVMVNVCISIEIKRSNQGHDRMVEVHWENYRPVASHLQIYYIMLYRVHLALGGFKLKTSVVIGTDCKGSLSPYDHDLDCSFLSL